MIIRSLNPSDAEDYIALRLEALKDSPYSFASSYEEEKEVTAEKYENRFRSPVNAFTLGVFEDSHLIGTAALVREELTKLSHKANLVAMYIKPEKRGEGIGKSLVFEVVEKARSIEGIEQINLSVVSTNIPGEKLYSSCGFEKFGIEKRALKIDNTYYDEAHMVLFL